MATFDIDTYISSLETCNSYSLKMIARGSPADICREFSYLSVRAMELQEQCQPMIEREIQSLNYILRKSDLEEFMQESCDSMIGEIEEEGDSKLKIRNVASKLAEQSKEIDRLRIEIETEKSEKERLRLLNDQLKITTNKEIHASKALKEELDKEKAKYDSGIEKLMQELDKNRATICILQENNDKLKQELDAGKMPKNSLQKDADEIREKLDKEIIANTTAQNDRDKLKQDLDNEKLTNKSVNIKNTNPVEKVSTYETPIKTLEDNAEKLKEELVTNKRDDVLCSYKSDPVLIHTITGKETGKKMKEIRGMTVLNRELFVLNEKSSTVHVYDSVKFTYRRQWDLKRLIRPEDIASCDRNKCLYIVDYKGFNKSKVIFRVEANGTPINNWSIGGSVGPAWEGSLSVTDESNVVLTLRWNDTINEYSSDGKLIRLINLSSDDRICNPNHAIKLANGHFLVSEGTSDLHRVCVVNADGRLQKSFGGKSGSNIGQMNGPTHLSIDRNGFVMVLDEWNSRVLLLDSDLNFYKEILPKEKYELDYRVRKILLDQSNGRLFVAQNEGLFNIDGKIMIFQIDVTK